jgi:hypothetical protein
MLEAQVDCASRCDFYEPSNSVMCTSFRTLAHEDPNPLLPIDGISTGSECAVLKGAIHKSVLAASV